MAYSELVRNFNHIREYKLDEKKYKIQVTYDKEDETEVLIRVYLSARC